MLVPLTQAVFDGKPKEIIVACVDYDGLLKYGDSTEVRFTWASERWRGANWLEKVERTNFFRMDSIERK